MGPFGDPATIDPEMAELMQMDADLENQTRVLVQRVEQTARLTTKAEETSRAKEQLKETVTKHFEVRQKRRELQIKRLEDELKRLQEAVAKRNESRDEIIKKRLTELLGPADDLEF